MPAFWEGQRLVVRFSPTEPGTWDFRVTSSLSRYEGREGSFTAAASEDPGFVRSANVHHWATENKQPHLWFGYAGEDLAALPQAEWNRKLEQIAAAKFTHVQFLLKGEAAFRAGLPDGAYLEDLEGRITAANRKGLTADVVLAPTAGRLTALFRSAEERERFLRYVVARYAPLHITWLLAERFEGEPGSREILKQFGLALKSLDPYDHPRSTGATVTSSPLFGDGWMTFIYSDGMNPQLGAIEHQLYPVPFVGRTTPRDLWTTTMNGQYPVLSGAFTKEPEIWHTLLADMRHWELEPYFDVDGGRAVALEDVEYLVWIESPSAPVEVSVEKHGYDVQWIDPATGAAERMKNYKGEHFTSEPPSRAHPWLLLISREGRKESMARSYKFESRPVLMQEIETQKVPFTIVEPAGDSLKASVPAPFGVKLTRETRATRSMMFLWTGEVVSGGHGFRVLGAGAQGTFKIPVELTGQLPSVLNVRVTALNANGKAYAVDKVFQLAP